MEAVHVMRGGARTDAAESTPAVREDTVNAIGGSRSGAGITNELSGVGGVQDSGALARPNIYREYLTVQELLALLRSSLYRRICMLPAWEATRKGFTLTDDTEHDAVLAKPMRDLKVLAKVRQAVYLARALSESRIWLVVDDGQTQDKPLRLDKVKKVLGLHVLDVNEFSPATYQTSVKTSADLGWPETYHVHPVRPEVPGHAPIVHHTRLLCFLGDELPPSSYGQGSIVGTGYADAVGQTMWDALRNLSQTSAAGARLAQEMSVFVLYMDGMPQRDSEKRSLFRAALRTLMTVKSVANGLVLGPKDRAERLTANAAGFKDLSEEQWQQLQAITALPTPLLRMSTPGGLNTDGQSWQTGWYGSFVPAFQEQHVRGPVETIAQCLYMQELGRVPDSWELRFSPLQEPTPLERAQVYHLVMQADQIAMEAGLVTLSQVRRSRFSESGFSQEMQPATEEEQQELEFGGGGEMSLEEAEAELAQLLQGQGGAVEQPAAAAEPAVAPASAAEAAPAERLNGAQLKSAQEMLAAVVAGTLTPQAAMLLLSEVVPAEKAQALVAAMRGAKPETSPEQGRQDNGHIPVEDSMPNVLLRQVEDGVLTWAEAIARLDASLPPSVRKMRIKVPAFMQGNAELGLELRDRFKRGMPAPEGGGPATGVLTANKLKSGVIDAEQVLLMAAWFARHFAPSQLKAKRGAEGWQDRDDPSDGWIAVLGWGDDGDGRGRAWVDRQAARINAAIEAAEERADADFTGKALISARLSEKGVRRWRELLGQVEGITGRLQGYDPEDDGIVETPHVTVLYLGAVDPEALGEIAETMVKEASRYRPEVLRIHRVKTLPAGPVSGDRTPVVAQVNAWPLSNLHHALLRSLAHLVKAKQFPYFEQHVTLGFATEMDGDALVALEELVPEPGGVCSPGGEVVPEPEPMGAVGELVLTYGGEVVARAPFLGRHDGKGRQDKREDEGPVGHEVVSVVAGEE